MPTERAVDFELEGKPHQALLVAHEGAPRPTVLVFHGWDGRTGVNDDFARRIAALGWNGVSADLYGKGVTGSTPEECQALMNPLAGDRARLRALLLATVEMAAGLLEADAAHMAAIGFCFGGLCVLDLARAGAPLAGVASFHGLFTPPGLPIASPMNVKVIAFHGWDDPMVPPEAVTGLGKELTEAGADWRIEAFGGAMHAFMNEGADIPSLGIRYDARTARRAWAALDAFLQELFEA